MTARELAGLLGRTGTLQAGGFTVRVRILDAKQAYGVDRIQVVTWPNDGDPARWINADRVTLDPTEQD